MGVSIDESLNFLDRVHDEYVDKILPGAIQPIIERCSPLRKFQVQDVNLLENPLGVVQGLPAALRQGAQPVPLVAYALATGVHADAVVVLQSTETVRSCEERPVY